MWPRSYVEAISHSILICFASSSNSIIHTVQQIWVSVFTYIQYTYKSLIIHIMLHINDIDQQYKTIIILLFFCTSITCNINYQVHDYLLYIHITISLIQFLLCLLYLLYLLCLLCWANLKIFDGKLAIYIGPSVLPVSPSMLISFVLRRRMIRRQLRSQLLAW